MFHTTSYYVRRLNRVCSLTLPLNIDTPDVLCTWCGKQAILINSLYKCTNIKCYSNLLKIGGEHDKQK